MSIAVRPAPWAPPREGFHWEAVEQGGDWLTPAIGAGRCRWGASPKTKACGQPAVATLMRGFPGKPWDYCAEHLYGRWIEDGKVMGWRLVADEAEERA